MINLSYNGKSFNQREVDGYVNVGQMCVAHGKLFSNWKNTNSAKEYLDALSASIGIPILDLVVVSIGNEGTWAHPLVAIEVARWINAHFGVWCNIHIKTLIETGKTEISKPLDIVTKQSEIAKSKLEIAEKSISILKSIGMFDDRDRFFYADYVRDAGVTNLYSLPSAQDSEITISERLAALGYKPERGLLITIGKKVKAEYISRFGSEPPKRKQYVDGAPRDVCSYRESDRDWIDNLIAKILGK